MQFAKLKPRLLPQYPLQICILLRCFQLQIQHYIPDVGTDHSGADLLLKHRRKETLLKRAKPGKTGNIQWFLILHRRSVQLLLRGKHLHIQIAEQFPHMQSYHIILFIRQLHNRTAVLIVSRAAPCNFFIKQTVQILLWQKRDIKCIISRAAHLRLQGLAVCHKQLSLMQTVQCKPDCLQYRRLPGIVASHENSKRRKLHLSLTKLFKTNQLYRFYHIHSPISDVSIFYQQTFSY